MSALSDLLQSRYGQGYAAPQLDSGDSTIYDTSNVLARMPHEGGLAKFLRRSAESIRGASRPDNVLAGGVGTAANWLDWSPKVGPDTAAPLGAGVLGSAFAAPGAVGIFGGRLARTADQGALRRAEEMAARGTSRDDIWRDTGWFRGVDGKWRFEIDDGGSAITNAATASAEYTGPRRRLDEAVDLDAPPGLDFTLSAPSYYGPMREGFHHPRLYDAYPSFMDDKFLVYRSSDPNGTHASLRGGRNEFSTHAPDDAARRSIALHEVQHGIQAREGFDPTLSIGPETSRLMLEHSNAIMQQVQPDPSLWQRMFGPKRPPPPSREVTDDLYRRINEVSADEYRRQAAEVEARNVQTRANMPPEQRRATPPWVTQDVPDNQQIVRRTNR